MLIDNPNDVEISEYPTMGKDIKTSPNKTNYVILLICQSES